MNDITATIYELKKKVDDFITQRDWQQFHDPKNMSMHIATEVAELMEIFRWIDNKESSAFLEKKRELVEQEIADIAYGLFNFCTRTNIDLASALEKKLLITEQRYPIEKSKGNNLKYTEL